MKLRRAQAANTRKPVLILSTGFLRLRLFLQLRCKFGDSLRKNFIVYAEIRVALAGAKADFAA